ncbi:MAG: hypothetical protein HYS13_00335 [Planctomycetia bacterium]|nr:hypothetical protein [Planctomycetia bacterium]
MKTKSKPLRILSAAGNVLFALACAAAGAGVGMLLREVRASQYDDEWRIVAEMTSEQKYALNENFETWVAFTNEKERQRLRDFRAKLLIDPQFEDLSKVMERYYAWTFTLTPGQPSELSALKEQVAERVQKVRQIQQEQDRRAPLPEADLPQLAKWLEDTLASRLREKMPKEDWEKLDAITDPKERRRRMFALIVPRWGSSEDWHDRLSLISDRDLQKLHDQLSQPSRDRLSAQPGLPEKRELLRNWIFSAAMRVWGREPGPEVSKEELLKFAREKLSKTAYEDLLQRAPSDIEGRLRFFYRQEHDPNFRGPWPGGRQGGPQGGPPGRARPGERTET